MSLDRKNLGKLGESVAASLIKSQGYKILERNFQTRFGEVDIVALDGDTLVFVEVKTRWSKDFGLPEEAVTPRKLKYIERVAALFRAKNQQLPPGERIDVVAIEVGSDKKIIRKELIRNASG
jgi:putative endonuclease